MVSGGQTLCGGVTVRAVLCNAEFAETWERLSLYVSGELATNSGLVDVRIKLPSRNGITLDDSKSWHKKDDHRHSGEIKLHYYSSYKYSMLVSSTLTVARTPRLIAFITSLDPLHMLSRGFHILQRHVVGAIHCRSR